MRHVCMHGVEKLHGRLTEQIPPPITRIHSLLVSSFSSSFPPAFSFLFPSFPAETSSLPPALFPKLQIFIINA